ncbi:phosphohistidine phosphatase SixA [Singulisphaera acidiphila]|uniref:Phosphohistidine phosphatase SixA n=1 Tax=Singulisphaera acidiphila (strain ATCC BAA-1392 / DSM 18658 / VKM B-2454 / MOB10) TaxID=886293 RepID=L0DJQ5_SINAD|nr:phosphohistidine phosphatase SixA [Singulisphaera acidiphila]AGA29487.1 phosphohistidine phosphatase SixA [Singulisphaera acidiphila DSM 18658]
MNQLYLLRHGIAVDHGDPDFADEDRPLTPEGEKRVKQVAKGFSRLDLGVDRIFSSPLPRARKTAEIVADVLGINEHLESVDVLRAGSSASTIRDWIGTRAEDRIMLVGHNPDLSDLLSLLIAAGPNTAPFELRKAGIAALSGTISSPMTLDWLARPRLLRKLGG